MSTALDHAEDRSLYLSDRALPAELVAGRSGCPSRYNRWEFGATLGKKTKIHCSKTLEFVPSKLIKVLAQGPAMGSPCLA